MIMTYNAKEYRSDRFDGHILKIEKSKILGVVDHRVNKITFLDLI